MPAMIARQGTIPANAGARDLIRMTAGAGAVVRRSVCLALAIPERSSIAFAPRALFSEKEARLLASGYEEGAYNALYAVARDLGFTDPHIFAIERAPSYGRIRDYLIGDCEVDERIAQRAAFDVVVRRNRLRTRRGWPGGEVGWI